MKRQYVNPRMYPHHLQITEILSVSPGGDNSGDDAPKTGQSKRAYPFFEEDEE